MSREKDEERLKRARGRADLARMRFTTALDATRRRLSPDRLKNDASLLVSDKVTEAKRSLWQSLRAHPIMTSSAVLGAAALVFWKPARIAAGYGLRIAELVWLNRNLRRP
jgi:hypothetical protein